MDSAYILAIAAQREESLRGRAGGGVHHRVSMEGDCGWSQFQLQKNAEYRYIFSFLT
jgi:hypothetical protein